METLKNVKAWMSQSHKNKTTLITSALTASTLSSRTNMRFNQRSPQLQNLLDYCVLVFKFNANALFLPHHTDSKFLLIVIYDSYNLQPGDALRIPAGTTYYLVNPHDNETLRVVTLVILVNKPGRFEGALLLPHFNSKAIVILIINEGEANIKLEEQPLELRRYRAELSEDGIFVIPAAYPFVVNATSNLNFLAFGINAENNQRNFLAGKYIIPQNQIEYTVVTFFFYGIQCDKPDTETETSAGACVPWVCSTNKEPKGIILCGCTASIEGGREKGFSVFNFGVRFPLLVLLGTVFLASVCVSLKVREDENNPFYLRSSNSFQTLFENQNGRIRLLQRFNKRSPQLENLRDYRIVQFQSKPNTILLPHHADADFLLFVLSGRAILTLVNNDDRDSYNLHPGDAQRIPAGTTYYLVNPHDHQNLKIIKLAIPVNKPGRYDDFFLSSTQAQQSYLQGFSHNILETSFHSEFEEINRVLLGEEEEQRQQEGVIVELSKEQIRQLSRRAKSSSRKTISSEDEPFNLRSRNPIYSNNFGKFFEITPEKNPQLRDLDIFLSSVDINEGALLLPHFNSKAIVILVINEGDANIELVGIKEQQQKQKQEEEPLEVQRYRAELSEDDVFVIPAAYPFVVNATSNLNFLAFGINAENNQRNFLAGEKDNVVRQIERQVQELAFPGSAQDVERLLKKQRESYFVDAQPQQKEEGSKGRKGPFPSILGALY
ncbi:Beta-conglycinin, beta chain [Glycine max]|nr:Beta-conglycinin, beta chain [Glycine max]